MRSRIELEPTQRAKKWRVNDLLMQSRYDLNHLENRVLVEQLRANVLESNESAALLLAHFAEVDARKLYLAEACSSMYDYATRVLHLSEGSALKRIRAARAARQFPMIFELVADGSIHLCGISVLAPVLTDANYRDLLARAKHKTKREIEELVAAIAPKPDVQSSMRKLPDKQPMPGLFAPTGAAIPPPTTTEPATAKATAQPARSPSGLTQNADRRHVVAPLSEDRFKVQFTAAKPLRDKLSLAQALM